MTLHSAVTNRIADFAAHARLAELPEGVVSSARDLARVCLAAGVRAAITAEAQALHELLGWLDETTAPPVNAGAVLGAFGSLPRSAAVAFNAACMRLGLAESPEEFPALVPGPAVISCVFGAAELGTPISRPLLEGVAVGAETGLRITQVMTRRMPSSGWLMEGIAGRVAAAVAVVKTFGGGADEFRQAIGLSATQAAGLACFAPSGAAGVLTGRAASDGLEAGLLSLTGWKGPERPLEGDRGLFRLITGEAEAGEVATGLGDDWILPRLTLDGYATEQARRLLSNGSATAVDSFLRRIDSTVT